MIESPILIIGCARSGTTLLYNILSEVSSLSSIGYESKAIIEQYHAPAVKGWESGVLTAADLTDESREFILRQFVEQAAPGRYWQRVNRLRRVVNRNGLYNSLKRHGRADDSGSGISSAVPGGGLGVIRSFARLWNRISPTGDQLRLLEKTPENCLRLPFLRALFPDARIIFLTRDGRANVHSLLEGWRQPHLFPGYQTPMRVTSPGQSRGRWAFTLIPGWRDLVDRPLVEICARQWIACNEAVLDFAAGPDALPMLTVRYEDLVLTPDETLERVAGFIGLAPTDVPAFGQRLPEVNAVTSPDMNKWRNDRDIITAIMPMIAPMMAKLGYDDLTFDSTDS